MLKTHDRMFTLLDKTPERDGRTYGRTDGQTDRQTDRQRSALATNTDAL